jgi:hypothetical protein
MMIVATIAMLIGAALATRFKVLVLIPAFGLGLAAIFATGFVYGTPFSTVIVASFLFVTGLQIGYISHGFIRILFASMRLPRLRVARSPRAAPSSRRPFIVAATANTAARRTSPTDSLM